MREGKGKRNWGSRGGAVSSGDQIILVFPVFNNGEKRKKGVCGRGKTETKGGRTAYSVSKYFLSLFGFSAQTSCGHVLQVTGCSGGTWQCLASTLSHSLCFL